jgi:quercetin dioxygenase-like cupin family protein
MRLHFLRSASRLLAVVAITASIGTVATGQGTPMTVAVVTSAAFPIAVAAGTYDLYAFVVEFPPGSGTPRHIHGGPVVVTVISGELVLQRSVGERILRAGESVIENPGDVHALINRSAAAARIAASELIPKGAAETTVVK